MGKLQGTDSVVVGLKDGFEVEREPVPESELPACGAG